MLLQNLGPRSFEIEHKQYATRIYTFIDNTRVQCLKAFRKVKVSDIIVEESPWDYLDLASKHSIGRHWWTLILKQIAQEMPQECKEFFMTEKEFWTIGMLGTLYINLKELFLDCIDSYHADFKAFYPSFENLFFRKIDEVRNRTLKTREIRRFLNVYKRCEPRRLHIFESLLEICTEPPLGSELTMEVLRTVFEEEWSRVFLFQFVPDPSSLEVMLWHAKQAKFDFWGMWQGRGGMSEYLNPVVEYISSDYRNSFSRVLLKYGFRYSSQPKVCIQQFSKFISYSYQNLTIGKLNGRSRLLKTNNHLRTMLIVDTFNTFVDPDGFEDIQDKTLTLVYLTRTIPEPYVTPKELYETLKPIVVHFFKPDLRKICDVYMEASVFEEDYSILQPRRLMHLCRCKVRDVLADKIMLPEGIRQLNLPLSVEMYLELKF